MHGLLPLVDDGAVARRAGGGVVQVGGDGLAAMPFGVDWLLAALTNVAVLGAVACYIGSFLSWMLILRRSSL